MFFFRHYLDCQAIYYIRSHYEGANDYEKLLAYGKENNIEFDYTTGSNYHNRFKKSDGFKRPYNEIGIDLKTKNYYNSTQADVKNGKKLENFHTFLHLIVITVFYMRKLAPQF